MDSILKDIYQGSIAFGINCPDISSDWRCFHTELMDQAPELEKQFEVLRSDINRAYFSSTEEMFYQGFSFALKLLCEGLAY